MGKLETGILGKSTGKIGPVITAGWKGLNVVKQYFIPANPRTEKQQQNRSRFSTCVNYARQILFTIIKPVWDKLAQNQSGFNLAVKEFMLTADQNNILTPQTKISRGSLVGIEGLSASFDGGDLQISWNNNSGQGNAKATDKLYVILFDKNKKIFWGSNFAEHRRDEEGFSYIPQGEGNLSNSILYAFFSQETETGKIYSDSSGRLLIPA